MTPEKQLELFDIFVAKQRELIVNKGSDYAEITDVLSNFKASSKTVKISVLTVIFLEVTKKLNRLLKLTKSKNEPKNEPITDSFVDLANYNFLAYCAWWEKEEREGNIMGIERSFETVSHEVLFCGGEKVFEGNLADCGKFLQSKAEPGFSLEGHGAVTRLVNKGNEYFVDESYYELRKT